MGTTTFPVRSVTKPHPQRQVKRSTPHFTRRIGEARHRAPKGHIHITLPLRRRHKAAPIRRHMIGTISRLATRWGSAAGGLRHPTPAVFTPDIVTFEFPLLLSVTANKLLFPVITFPKLRLAGFALSMTVPTLTVSVARLLVAFPIELLTTTSNVAPLSAIAVAGVV